MIINHFSHIQDRFGNLFFILLQIIKLFGTLIVVIYMILKELLAQYEIENDLSHKQMAQLLNVSTSTYYRWLSGESTKLKRTTINKPSEIFDCDIEGVLEETNRLKPILGKVKAGYDLWTNQDVEGYLEVGKSDAERGDYFLRVVGDSMVGSHIYEDDLVFVQQCNSVNSGDIAIVMIDEEVTIKKVYFKNDNLILVASNLKYEDRYFDQEEIERQNIQIIGKVLFVRRDFFNVTK